MPPPPPPPSTSPTNVPYVRAKKKSLELKELEAKTILKINAIYEVLNTSCTLTAGFFTFIKDKGTPKKPHIAEAVRRIKNAENIALRAKKAAEIAAKNPENVKAKNPENAALRAKIAAEIESEIGGKKPTDGQKEEEKNPENAALRAEIAAEIVAEEVEKKVAVVAAYEAADKAADKAAEESDYERAVAEVAKREKSDRLAHPYLCSVESLMENILTASKRMSDDMQFVVTVSLFPESLKRLKYAYKKAKIDMESALEDGVWDNDTLKQEPSLWLNDRYLSFIKIIFPRVIVAAKYWKSTKDKKRFPISFGRTLHQIDAEIDAMIVVCTGANQEQVAKIREDKGFPNFVNSAEFYETDHPHTPTSPIRENMEEGDPKHLFHQSSSPSRGHRSRGHRSRGHRSRGHRSRSRQSRGHRSRRHRSRSKPRGHRSRSKPRGSRSPSRRSGSHKRH
jgi:hypothetical protein